MRHRHLMVLAIAVMGTAILGSSVWTPGTPVQAAGTTVTIPGDSYLPAALMIEVGQTVTWVNKDSDPRSEEHTSELQSRENLVCRLLLEKKKKINELYKSPISI